MEPFIGQIIVFGGDYAPSGWASCDGQVLNIRDYTLLFSLLGTRFGGDGISTFALPNLNGRVSIGAGTGPGLTPRRAGESGGAERFTLGTANLPPHSHAVRVSSAPGEEGLGPAGARLGEGLYTTEPADSFLATDALSSTGAGQPVPTQMPMLVARWCIALEGIYPSRA